MRIIVAITAMLVAGFAALTPAHATEVDVIGADLIRVEGKEWRIAFIEAPQMDSACAEERTFAQAGRAKLAEILSDGEVVVSPASAAATSTAAIHINVQGKLEIIPTGGHDMQQRETANLHINGHDVASQLLSAGMAARRGHGRPLCFAVVEKGEAVEASTSGQPNNASGVRMGTASTTSIRLPPPVGGPRH